MRALFTSDIHGRLDAWQAYAGLLAEGNSANGSCRRGKTFIAVNLDRGILNFADPAEAHGTERSNG
jgi:hypothetical protein